MHWALEFVLQIIGWSTLALGGGSRLLLANAGSAAMIGSTPLAVAVILGSAVLIWVTRRSPYKREYRGY